MCWLLPLPLTNFNPRSREGSDGFKLFCIHVFIAYFNPRSREGSDPDNSQDIPVFSISIHAPAKGATTFVPCLRYFSAFQSTLPRRERLFLLLSSCYLLHISIHAPAKGATVRAVVRERILEFQSTLPRRERRNMS